MNVTKHTINGKESTNWYFKFELNGKRYFGSTKTSNKAIAKRISMTKHQEAVKALEFGVRTTITIGEALTKYYNSRKYDKEANVIERVCRKLQGSKKERKRGGQDIDIFGFNPTRLLHTLTDKDIQELILARKGEGNGSMTIHHELVHLNQAVALSRRLNYEVPTLDLREMKKANKIRQTRKVPKFLTPDEEARLLHELHPNTAMKGVPKNRQEQVRASRLDAYHLAILLFDIGGRHTEIAHLKWVQIDLKKGVVKLMRSKTNNEGTLLLSTRALDVLKERRKTATSEWVFLNKAEDGPRNYCPGPLKSAAKRAGITKNVTHHIMRHSFASKLAQNNVSLYQIQTLLGHANSSTTEIYASLIVEDASAVAKGVLDKLNGG